MDAKTRAEKATEALKERLAMHVRPHPESQLMRDIASIIQSALEAHAAEAVREYVEALRTHLWKMQPGDFNLCILAMKRTEQMEPERKMMAEFEMSWNRCAALVAKAEEGE